MKSSRSESTVPPGRFLQRCQQHSAHIVSIYPDVTAVALQLPSTVTHTWLSLIPIHHCMHWKGLVDIVLTVDMCKGISSFLCLSGLEQGELPEPLYTRYRTKKTESMNQHVILSSIIMQYIYLIKLKLNIVHLLCVNIKL